MLKEISSLETNFGLCNMIMQMITKLETVRHRKDKSRY